MFSTFDLRLLLYVIRLAGWLKHCNLSLSLSLVSLLKSAVGTDHRIYTTKESHSQWHSHNLVS